VEPEAWCLHTSVACVGRVRVTPPDFGGTITAATTTPAAVHARWHQSVLLIGITQFIVFIGYGLGAPFIPLYLVELGVTDRAELALWTGLIAGLGTLPMAIASPVWGVLSDRFGPKTMLMRALIAGSAVLTLMGLAANVWHLFTARVLQSVFAGSQTAASTIVAAIAPASRVGYAFGVVHMAVQVGNLVGPVVGSVLISSLGIRATYLVGGALLTCCTLISWFLVAAPPITRTVGGPPKLSFSGMLAPFAWVPLRDVLTMGALVQSANTATMALMAIYMQDLARPSWLSLELGIALSVALTAATAALAMPVLGTLADRGEPRRVLGASVTVLGLSLAVQGLVVDAIPFLVLRLVAGLGVAGSTASMAVLTRRAAPPGLEGRAYGSLASVHSLGWTAGPLAGSVVAAALGLPALFLISGVLALALIVPIARAGAWMDKPKEAALPGGLS
jgi:MFS family permease